MENSINTLPVQKNLEDIINEQNLLIFDEENWVWKDLWKISEVTYSYDEQTWINTTLFVKLWKLDLEFYKKANNFLKERLLKKSKYVLINTINKKKTQIQTAKDKITLFEIFSQEEINNDLKDIFINSLNEKNDFLDYCLNGINFELEKTWINSWILEEEEIEIEKTQEKLDKKLFWWNIKDNPEEIILAYESVYTNYIINKNKLSKIEQIKFESYLSKIKLPKLYKYDFKKIKKNKPKSIVWDFLDLDIPKSDYILWFNILVEALEKLEHIVESNDSAKSISDGPKWVQFPTSEKFNHIKMLRFFLLWNHEIETHNITDYNSKQLLGNLRGSNSTEKDEWVAMLMEQLFKYWKELYKIDEDWDLIIDINKIQINSYFTKTLMWEILNNDELFNFLELSEIIDPDVISPIDRYNRLKRNNKLGVQHKDTTYTRWLLKAIKEINLFIKSKWKRWINPEDLFLWKISFNETSKLKNIKKYKEKKWKKIEILKPLFISDAVYYSIDKKLNWKGSKINSEWFYKYLKNKYPIFNFTKQQIKEISYTTKRNVNWIVNIMLKNIWENNLDNIWKNRKQTNKVLMNIISEQYRPKIEKVKNRMHHSRKNAT